MLLAARAFMGVSEACYIPAALALIADYHRGPTRSLATGLHMSGIYAGMSLGGLGGYLAEWFSWRWAFGGLGCVGVCYAVVLSLCLHDAPPAVASEVDASEVEPLTVSYACRGLLGRGAFWILLLVTAMFGIANWGINGWLPTYLRDHFSLGLGAAGLSATAYIQAASFGGVLYGGRWADQWSQRNPRGRALVPAIGFAAAAPFLLLAASTNVLPLAIVGLIVYGLSRGFFDANLMPVLRQVTDQRLSATGYALLNVVSCATGGITIWLAGRLKDYHVDLGQVFKFSAAAILMAAFLLLALRPKNQPD
jgi:MFS family permease